MSASLGGGAWPPGCAAQLTRMSTPPSSATARPTIALTESSEPVSHAMATTRLPVSAVSARAVASRSTGSRATMATVTPSLASSWATALPMPRLPPVTMAVFPRNSRSMACECRTWSASAPGRGAAQSVDVAADWASWLRRWEAQQRYYLPEREERFQVMIGLLHELAGATPAVLDLGSGPGSLARRVLDWLPGARVVAIDADPLLLELGRQAVGDRGGSIRWLQADLRSDSWGETVRTWGPVDAALSTTALHWLSPREQADVFARLAGLIRVGGILVNGDHLTFDQDQQRIAAAAKALQEEDADRDAAVHPAETWSEWWQAVEAEPAFASLVSERRSRWGAH